MDEDAPLNENVVVGGNDVRATHSTGRVHDDDGDGDGDTDNVSSGLRPAFLGTVSQETAAAAKLPTVGVQQMNITR